MHAAKIDSSPRLQRVLEILQTHTNESKHISTRGLMQSAHVCAVSTAVAELRANGHNIKCKREGMIWWYWLA